MQLVRAFLTYALFPLWFLGAQVVAWRAYAGGLPGEAVLIGIAAATVVLLTAAERIHPEFPGWNRSRGDIGTDAVHVVVSNAIVPHLLGIGLPALLLGLTTFLAERSGGSPWPLHWPIAAQLLLAMAISAFGEYWVHRLAHEVPLLWRLHSVHHSPERLYWLNAARFHPLDVVLSFCAATGPLVVLGAGEGVLVLVVTWITVHGLFQHCNVHLRLGPLNYVFSMAELHRWHHSLVLEEANANYGNNVLLWDLVFGTVFWPRDRDAGEAIGIADLPHFPRGYLGQLLAPFRWKGLQPAATVAPDPNGDPARVAAELRAGLPPAG